MCMQRKPYQGTWLLCFYKLQLNPTPAESFLFYIHSKQGLLTQFPASIDKNIYIYDKTDISNIEVLD